MIKIYSKSSTIGRMMKPFLCSLLLLLGANLSQAQVTLFSEDWASSSYTTNGWTFTPSQGNWKMGSNYTPPGATSPNAYFDWTPSTSNYNISLVSPIISGSAFINMTLDYKLYLDDYGGSLESMDIEYKTTSAASWTLLTHYDNSNGDFNVSPTNVALPGTDQSDFQIRFRVFGSTTFNINGWGIDDIVVKGTSAFPCSGTPAPGNTLTSVVGDSVCAGQSFTLSLQTSTPGSGVTYQWQTSPDNVTWSNVGTSVSAFTTTQTQATYYRAEVTCLGATVPSNSVLVTMKQFYSCYCQPLTGTSLQSGGADNYVANITISGAGLNSTTTTTPGNGYSQILAPPPSNTAALEKGVSYPVSISVPSGYGSGYYYGLYIDWNQDGDFNDADEYITTSATNSSGVATGTITVPTTATTLTGLTGLRVRGSYSTFTASDPCTVGYYGETEDYVISVLPQPSCLPISGLMPGAITATDATITWTASTSNPAFGYEYYYSATNTPPTSTTTASGSVGVGVTTATITSLTPQTPYYIWVRSVCTPVDMSSWFGPLTITTQCAPVVAPYTYGFETHTGPTTVMTDCWTSTPSNNTSVYAWTLGTAGSQYSTGTGPIAAHGGTKYVFTEASSAGIGNIAELISPLIDVSALTTPQLEFWYHMYGTSVMGSLETSVWNGTTWNVVDLMTGPNPQQTSETSPWLLKVIPLTGYTGAIQVKFKATSNGSFEGDIAVDDVAVIQAPTCQIPTLVTLGTVTSTDATISWTASGSNPALGYEYYYSPNNTAPTSTTTASGSVGVGVTTVTLTGLPPSTTQYFWVRANCAANDASAWAGPLPFTTACAPVASFPWTEGFEGLTTVGTSNFPPCWFEQNGDWATSSDVTYNTPFAGTKYLRNSWAATNEHMWTPGFQLTQGTSYDLSFMVQGDGWTGWVVDVLQNSSQSSTGATQVGSSYNVPGTGTIAMQPYVKQTFTFVPTTSGVYYFAIRVNQPSGSPWYVAFDNFDFRVTPTCTEPTTLTGTTTANSATINWVASISNPGLGYEYYYDVVNTAPTAASTPSGSVSAGITTATISGLNPASTYYVWVRSNCGGNDYSTWAGPYLAVTQCATVMAPYTYDVESHTGNTTVMANCWTSTPSGSTTSYAWTVGTSGSQYSTGTGPIAAHGGTKYLFTEASYGSLGSITELLSPMIDVSALTVPQLEFWYHMFGTAVMGSLETSVWNGTSWTVVDLMTGPNAQQTTENSPWLQKVIPLTGYTGVIQLKFKATSNGTFQGDIAIDDISVVQAPACIQPTGLAVPTVTATTADVTWTTVAGAVGYEYAIDQTSTAAPGATTTVNTTTSNTPPTVTGLTGANTYYLHVRTDCGAVNGYSQWSVFSFATPPPNDPCANAVNISNSQLFTGTTSGASQSMAACDATSNANDVWYTITTGSVGGSVTVNVNTTVGDIVMEVFSGTCGSFTGLVPTASSNSATTSCVDQVATGLDWGTYTFAANTTYYVRVYGYNGANSTFTIEALGTPLAVKLSDISATNVGKRNRIDWITASETAGDKFELERSADGRNFSLLATVDARGTASTYSYWDEKPVAGVNYYRLRMMDAAGSLTYSDVVTAKVAGSGAFTVEAYPNPVSEMLTVKVYGAAGNNPTVSVSDITGKVVKVVTVTNNEATINMSGLAQGMYLVKYTDNNNTETIKVNKK